MRYRDFLKNHLENIADIESRILPSGFHLVGHVALLHLNFSLKKYASEIGQATLDYDRRIKSVAIQTGPTEGQQRVPSYKIVAGDCNTITTHVEDGIMFRLDPLRITFSGGNRRERIDIAKRIGEGEKIVDMFSCVGQFALHIAKADCSSVIAIEINPEAYEYLVENIKINNLENKVTAILGDCRDVHPSNFADRVVMGYLHDTVEFLPFALKTLVKDGGVIHMHMAVKKNMVDDVLSNIKMVCIEEDFASETTIRKIKNYSPGVDHVIFDISVTPKSMI